jgi:hypothetical protein
MTQPDFRILYCSQNLIGNGGVGQQRQIDGILQAARNNNRKLDVTGALLYNDGFFAQVLEGPRTGIEKIFEKIQRDNRHNNITVLETSAITSRDFPDWSMAFVHPVSEVQAADTSTALHRAMMNPEAAGHSVLEILRGLVAQED